MQEVNVLYGPPPQHLLKEQSLGQYVFDALKSNCNQSSCMTDMSTGSVASYKDVLKITCQLATAVLRNGYKTNDVIAISGRNSINFLYPVIASFYAGLTVAPLNENYTERELQQLLNISTPKIVFCSIRTANKFVKIKEKCTSVEKIILLDDSEPLHGTEGLMSFISFESDANIVNTFQPVKCDWNDTVALIMSSSGTSGVPKNVMITQKNVIVTIENKKDPLLGVYHSLKPGDHAITFLPIFHAFGLITILKQITSGYHTLLMKQFEITLFLNTVQKYKVKCVYLNPTIVIALIKSQETNNFDISCLEEIYVGSSSLKENILQSALNKLKIRSIRQAYGMTESTMVLTFTPVNDLKIGSSGKLVPYLMGKIIDLNSKENLRAYETGELCFKGDVIMKGYLKNETATKEVIDKDGWLHTGDFGFYDNDGHFYIQGRLKEIIKYNGFQVSPIELEMLLLEHPKIKDAAVFGIPHETAEEVPAAFIVLQLNSSLSENEVKEFIASNVVYYKYLRGGVKFIKEIPKTLTGKFNKNDLSKLFLQTSKL